MQKFLTVCLIIGVIGVSVVNIQMSGKTKKLQTEVTELQVKNGALKFLLDNCIDDRVEAREENFIPSPGRFYAQEIDLHDLISEFFSDNDEQRICFGRGWAR
jgi:hypothetical protein